MIIVDDLKALNGEQRAAFTAALLGWTLDAFDFFLLTFVLADIARDFGKPISMVSEALFLTLVMRPVGALVFGWLAEKYGRRPILMIDVALYAAFAFASAFSTNLTMLLVLRALFGFAMGGEWGIGASLALESIPVRSRGVVSGLLEQGYGFGMIAAALVNPLVPIIHWRGLLAIGVLPALLVLYIRRNVKESPAWEARRARPKRENFAMAMARAWRRMLYAIVLMTAFTFFSHGTQDLYPTFLKVQHHFSPVLVSTLTIFANFGGILGGVVVGALSERYGRKVSIIVTALLALPLIPLWAFASTPVMLGIGAFLMQVTVGGAWGVAPVHLTEMAPAAIRGVFPGLTYQIGALLSSRAAVTQAKIAETHGNNYGLALAIVCAGAVISLAIWTFFGPEAKGRSFELDDDEASA